MDIFKLITEATNLKSLSPSSPKIELWQERVGIQIEKEYGPKIHSMFDNLFISNVYVLDIYDDTAEQRRHEDKIDKIIEFLEGLREENFEMPTKIVEMKDLHELNAAIAKDCNSTFINKDYAESVDKSYKIVKEKLRALTGYEKGSDAFGNGRLHIKGAVAPHVDEDFNKGVMYLLMAIDRFRDEKSHSVAVITNPQKAYEYLSLSSLAMNLLDEAEILPRNKT